MNDDQYNAYQSIAKQLSNWGDEIKKISEKQHEILVATALAEEKAKMINGRLDHIEKELEKLEHVYARKWVERVIWGGGGVIGTAVTLALLDLIIV